MVINSLSVHPCLKTLDRESCQDLDRQCTWLKTPAGAWAVGQADDDLDVYFVLAGRIRVALHGVWCESVSSDMEAGSFFGELTALEGVPGSLSAFALDDSTLAKMPNTVFVATMFSHRPLGEAVVATLVVRNRAMTRKVAEAANIYGDGLASAEATLWRSAQIRFDVDDRISHISANHRRARRWS
jgi:CRP-like cAMP-binding protein